MLATSGGGRRRPISRSSSTISRRLDEERVGPGLAVREGARDRVLEPDGLPRIGPRDDDEAAVPARLDGRTELPDLFGDGDDPLPRMCAAALRPDLILEEDAGGAGAHQVAHRAHHVDGVAVAGIGVDHDGHVDRRAYPRRRRHDLRLA